MNRLAAQAAPPVYLVTGATGNLGFAVIRRLIEEGDARVLALTRAASADLLRRALVARLGDRHDRVDVVTGDVRAPLCGLGAGLAAVADAVTDVVHCAADVRWHAPADELLATNTDGTRNLLDLAARLDRARPLRRVTVVSSTYVSGRREGRLPERPIPAPGFNNAYEASKWLAERIALARTDLPVAIVRPSILVGDSRDGSIENFTTIYFPFRLVQQRALRLLPGHATSALDLVPTDHVARVIEAVHAATLEPGTIVHACAGESVVTLRDIWRIACAAFDDLAPGQRPRTPGPIVPPILLRAACAARFLLPARPRATLAKMKLFLPYLSMRRRFEVDGAAALGLPPAPAFESYATQLCRFALQARYRPARERVAAPARLALEAPR